MEINFQSEGKKKLWNQLKASNADDSFAKAIIEYAENCMLKMQEEIYMQGEEVLAEINWQILEKKINSARYSSIEDYQKALDRIKLHETDFQWIIKKSLKIAQPQNITKEQKECAIKFIGDYWRYGKKFNRAMERTKIAEKLKKEQEDPVMYLSPKAKRGL